MSLAVHSFLTISRCYVFFSHLLQLTYVLKFQSAIQSAKV
nr:MAG TPA: hypothetical protein [Caudoviricetes sp.]